MSFDLTAYLARIGLNAPRADAEGLRALQAAHLRAFPFENLDPLLGKVPDLSPAALWAKLVVGRRGGYCFELNGLLGQALEALGFPARRVMARVRRGLVPGARTHLAWVVTLDGSEWLADAGFGGPAPVFPLLLEHGLEQEAGGVRFRFVAQQAETVLERLGPNGWFPLYGFDGAPSRDIDVEAANFLCARWDHAPFPRNLMLNRIREDGRVSVFNRAGKTESAGGVQEWTIRDAGHLHAVLAETFGLAVGEDVAAAVWERISADEHIAALGELRGRLPKGFRFDREEANER